MADEEKEKQKRKPKQQDKELDFNAVLADLNRQAHDKELEALANLTLLQSGFEHPEALSPEEQERRDLDERLKKIISDLDRD